jgi:hypothetical protein
MKALFVLCSGVLDIAQTEGLAKGLLCLLAGLPVCDNDPYAAHFA